MASLDAEADEAMRVAVGLIAVSGDHPRFDALWGSLTDTERADTVYTLVRLFHHLAGDVGLDVGQLPGAVEAQIADGWQGE